MTPARRVLAVLSCISLSALVGSEMCIRDSATPTLSALKPEGKAACSSA